MKSYYLKRLRCVHNRVRAFSSLLVYKDSFINVVRFANCSRVVRLFEVFLRLLKRHKQSWEILSLSCLCSKKRFSLPSRRETRKSKNGTKSIFFQARILFRATERNEKISRKLYKKMKCALFRNFEKCVRSINASTKSS